jgi:hypothetical protein
LTTSSNFIGQKNNRLEQNVDNKIDDLKQFILQQTTALQQGIRGVERKVDDLSIAVAQAIDTVNATTDAQFKSHEQRMARLERHARITS